MRRFLFMVTLLLALPAAAQEYSLKTGIMDFHHRTKDSPEVKTVTAALSSALGSFRFISLVERSKLGALAAEIALGETGLIDPDSAARIGKVHGLQAIVEGSITPEGVRARVIHTETAKIIATGSVAGVGAVDQLGLQLASGVETFIMRENLKRMRNDAPDIEVSLGIRAPGGRAIAAVGKQGSVKVGSTIEFTFSASHDGYLTIIDIQPSGDVVVLYPNDFSGSNQVKAGVRYAIPGPDDGFELSVTEPAGTDTVIAFFTRRKVDWLDVKKLQGEGFRTVPLGERLAIPRAISVMATGLTRKDWESVELTVEVAK
jgi:hypothetical protein